MIIYKPYQLIRYILTSFNFIALKLLRKTVTAIFIVNSEMKGRFI